jgi:hypothetical protein
MAKLIWSRSLSLISGALGGFLLYLGSGMLLLVPPGNGERYWDWHLVAYGVFPTILSACLIVLAGWLWSLGGDRPSLGAFIRNSFNLVVAGVVLFWIVLVIIAHLRARIP